MRSRRVRYATITLTLAAVVCAGLAAAVAQSVQPPQSARTTSAADLRRAEKMLRHGIELPALEMRIAAVDAFVVTRDAGRIAGLLRANERLRTLLRRARKAIDSARRTLARGNRRRRARAARRIPTEQKRERAAALVSAHVLRALGTLHGSLPPHDAAAHADDVFQAIDAARASPRRAERLAAIDAFTASGLPDRFDTLFAWHAARIDPAVRKRFGVTAPPAGRVDASEVAALRAALGRRFESLTEARRAAIVSGIRDSLRGAVDRGARIDHVELLGYLPAPGAQVVLEGALASAEPELRMVAAEALGRQRQPSAVLALAKALADGYWQVRVMAIEALGNIGGIAAVDTLVRFVARAEGRIAEDVERALHRLTGRAFHGNPVLWQKWWRENKRQYDGPPPVAAAVTAATQRREAYRTRTTGFAFYGIQSRSKRVVFILDISGSMNEPARLGTPAANGRRGALKRSGRIGGLAPGKGMSHGGRKIDQAIGELNNAIGALAEDATFNIVFYSGAVSTWRSEQIVATSAQKESARTWAERVHAHGATNLYGAIERAFELAGKGTLDPRYPIAADTFFLLSDGQPTSGLTDPEEIFRAVRRKNRFQRVRIHTIAIGAADADFMKRLAVMTGGDHIHYGAKPKTASR